MYIIFACCVVFIVCVAYFLCMLCCVNVGACCVVLCIVYPPVWKNGYAKLWRLNYKSINQSH